MPPRIPTPPPIEPPPRAEFPVLRVVPLPTTYTTGSTPIIISPDLSFVFLDGISADASPPNDVPADLLRATERTKTRLRETRHQYLSPTGGSEFFPLANTANQPQLTFIHLRLLKSSSQARRSIAECARAKAEDRPDLEAYTLSIPLQGAAEITSTSCLGLLRGLTTLEQLVFYLPSTAFTAPLDAVSADKGGDLYVPFAPYHIHDRPAFGWRGLMLDTSRNWYGPEAIKKLLDTMFFVKLNVFHWHITDSNSWPLDLKDRPELAEKGAYSSTQKYSEDEIRDLIDYGLERGIDTFLEVDIPGHTTSLAGSHPEHIASANILPANPYSNQPPAGQLRFATDATVEWTKGLMGDMVRLIGDGEYVGTGGDEVNERCMMADPVTRASLNDKGITLDEALDHFLGEVHAPILAAGKTPVVWQDMVLSHGPVPHLTKQAVVKIWQGVGKDAKRVIEKGFRIVHAPGLVFSLDGGQGSWIATPHGDDNVNNYRTWAKMMSYDPYACIRNENGVEDEQLKKLVLGGQASMWSEQTDETNLECVIWPRTAAVADLYWTGDKVGGGYPRNTIEALARMHDVRYRMVDRGVRAIPLQPHWCALRPELSVHRA